MKSAKIHIFTFPGYEFFGSVLEKNTPSIGDSFTVRRFPNKELYISIQKVVRGSDCVIIGSIAPPEEHLFAFLALAHTLKKEGACKVIAFIPYLSYSRQDRPEDKKSRITALLGKLFFAAGIDEIVTVDVHSPLIHELFPMPVHSLSTAKLFAHALITGSFSTSLLVAPDQGAVARCLEVAKFFSPSNSVVFCEKKRKNLSVSHEEIHGQIGSRVVLIDDILDTGKTLVSCCEKLLQKGVEEIFVCVTHGLFTAHEWEKLWTLSVKKIYCTNTVPLAQERIKEKRIVVLSIEPLIQEYFENIFR